MSSANLATVFLHSLDIQQAMMEGHSLDHALERDLKNVEDPVLRAAIQAVSYDTVRHLAASWKVIEHFANRPPAQPVTALLETAIARMIEHPDKDFVTVDQAVKAARENPSTRPSAGFINAILRRFGRERDSLMEWLGEQESVRFNIPDWWYSRYKKSMGKAAKDVLELQQSKAPLTLRVNARKTNADAYIAELKKAGIEAYRSGMYAVTLKEALPVREIPGFAEGVVSVQDAGSQLAVQTLDPKDGEIVLDACAAPGGKSTHMLELADIELTAVEISPSRTEAIHENLKRLGLEATVRNADAADIHSWWDRRKFDAILLDAPCTASGVARRHPDIPWQHVEHDVSRMSRTQKQLLETLWPLVKKDGRGFLLLPAVVLYHLGPGIGLIAQHLAAYPFLKGLDKVLREALREGGHRLGRNNSRQLPVSDGGILAAALFRHAAVGAHRGRRRSAAAHLINIKDAHFRQHRDIQLGGSGAGTQGIAARIAKVCAIRHFAAAAAIQHNEKNALFHSLYSLLPTPQRGVKFREIFPMLYCITFLA